MKNTMKELRQLTKRAKDFKDRYDMEFSTEVLENAMKIPDEHDQVCIDCVQTLITGEERIPSSPSQ